MNTHISHSLEETAAIAREWLGSVAQRYADSGVDADEALIVGLSGHLGAGKTAFVKEAARALGVTEDVTSPTFVIMKIYETTPVGALKDIPWKRLIHIDAYRLERREELEALGWEKLVADPHNLIMVEWPENVGLDDLPESSHIRFEAGADRHEISIS
jgi:tRNA threonylcarbamoyl adenosine modification protein YjeE